MIRGRIQAIIRQAVTAARTLVRKYIYSSLQGNRDCSSMLHRVVMGIANTEVLNASLGQT